MFTLTSAQMGQLKEFKIQYNSGNYEIEFIPKSSKLKPLKRVITWESIYFSTPESIKALVEDLFKLLNNPKRETTD